MNNAYLCGAVRTPIGRYGGALAGVRPDDLLALVLRALVTRNPSVDWDATGDVIVGCANQAGEDNRNVARMGVLLAGLSTDVPGVTVNRLCGSGLDAVSQAARAIASGEAELVIAGGVESMSRAPFVLGKSTVAFDRRAELADTTIGWRMINPAMRARYGVDSMPQTAETVAREHSISRLDQDAFALRSQQRAARAIEQGRFVEEIEPIPLSANKEPPLFLGQDEHPRSTSHAALARLPPVVSAEGTVTAGNSSGVNDGAAVLLMASESAAVRYGLVPLARIVASAVRGVEPRVMGLGPVPATRALLAHAGVPLGAVDWIELNEAFAAQALAVLRQLGLPDDAEHVNPNGGAIALGHPLGMSGARLAMTAALQLHREGGRLALCTMCIGVGQGIAVLLERV